MNRSFTSTLIIFLLFISPFFANEPLNRKTEISHACDISQGFNYNPDAPVKFGYLTRLDIGDSELSNDFSVTGPDFETMNVVGILSTIYWEGSYFSPIEISAQISTMNKNRVNLYLAASPDNRSVKFTFFVYDYDLTENQFYRCFYNVSIPLEGIIQQSGSDLQLFMENDPSPEVPSPMNFNMQITILPDSISQSIGVAVSPDQHFVQQWGISPVALRPFTGTNLPGEIELEPAYPNPFNPRTKINYRLLKNSWVNVKVYDIMGQLVKTLTNSRESAGRYQVVWDGKNSSHQPVASGVYLLVLKAGSSITAQKILLIR